jgi:hypothetical protein
LDEYCDWIQADSYSVVLYDGSFLQLTYDFDGDDLVGHRLAYYPCPYDIDPAWLEHEPLADVVELHRADPKATIRMASPIRFDYSESFQGEGHPASHLTIITNDCRWAVTSALSPGHFVRFIFRHFYPAVWARLSFVRTWPQPTGKRTITEAEESLLHISCGRG